MDAFKLILAQVSYWWRAAPVVSQNSDDARKPDSETVAWV